MDERAAWQKRGRVFLKRSKVALWLVATEWGTTRRSGAAGKRHQTCCGEAQGKQEQAVMRWRVRSTAKEGDGSDGCGGGRLQGWGLRR